MNNYLKSAIVAAGLCAMPAFVSGQNIGASVFMKDLHVSNRINPAYQPERGFLAIPLAGGMQAEFASTGMMDMIDALTADEDILHNDSFYNGLHDYSNINTDMDINILSFGWWKGRNYWSVNIGLKTDASLSVPKSLFNYLREVNLYDSNAGNGFELADVDIRNMSMRAKAYSEIGVGYSRQINEKLTVGGRAKMLLGLLDVDMTIDEVSVDMRLPEDPNDPESWQSGNYGGSSVGRGHIRAAYHGGGLSFDEEGHVDGFDMNGFGIAGYGFGVDLGATYSPIQNLNVSAAVLDLGRLKWQKSSTSMARADKEAIEITPDNYDSYLQGEIFDLDMYDMRKVENNGYTTGLNTTLMLGAEYLLGSSRQFSVGAMYSARFLKPSTRSTINLVGGFVPEGKFFHATAAYSYIQETGSSLSSVLKLGRFFIGADYVFAGTRSGSFNAFLGTAFPLGKTKSSLNL